MTKRKRFSELKLKLGRYNHYSRGHFNSITDISGVLVGHSTITKGTARTGVTAVLPNGWNIFRKRLHAGAFVLNGAGEVSGITQLMEWGLIETPILLTSTLAVGTCYEGLVKVMLDRFPEIGNQDDVIIPMVAECDDSWLNDARKLPVRESHVREALKNAKSGPTPEGNVGGGTGMVCFDFKGGIGTASRRLPRGDGGYTIGVLVMSNFGKMKDLNISGVPVGHLLAKRYLPTQGRKAYGSIITVVATDAPLSSHQLSRVAKRAALGIGQVGSYAANGSGEIIIAFSTANPTPRNPTKPVARMSILHNRYLDPVFAATAEATEEAILNSLFMAQDMDGINGHHAPALPIDEVIELLARQG